MRVGCQPSGTNIGLPPSATATGLAPQILPAEAVTQIQNKLNFTNTDLMQFLINTECLEATFDSYGAWGVPMHPALTGGGPAPIGGRKANLSPEMLTWVEEAS